MPNRILKESICTSENIDSLSAFQETVFYRLIVTCDDYGRMDARPKLLSSKLFPLKDIRAAQIEDALRALTSAELVILYEVDGKPFLQMKTWDRHQQVRAKKSRYPSPDDGIKQEENNCNQLVSDDSKCPRNPIQSESLSESESNPNARMREIPFEEFWNVYPKRSAKQDAIKAWKKLKVDETLFQTIVAAIERQKKSSQWQEDGGKYIPHPATWLNGHRWEDEVVSGSHKTVAQTNYAQRDYEQTKPGELPQWYLDMIEDEQKAEAAKKAEINPLMPQWLAEDMLEEAMAK